jgi:hypothetical protein
MGFGLARPYMSSTDATLNTHPQELTHSALTRCALAGRWSSHLAFDAVHFVVLQHSQLAVLAHPPREARLCRLNRVRKVV